MKLGFLAQPTDVLPSAASVAIWIGEVAERVAETVPTWVLCRAVPSRPAPTPDSRVELTRIDASSGDRSVYYVRRVERLLSGVAGRRVDLFHRFLYFGPRYYVGYVREAGRRARAAGIDTLLVMNFSQFLPVLREMYPELRLVLVMHCDWLVQLPEAKARRWASNADLILGCSNYIRDGIRRRLPELAARTHTLYNGSSETALHAGGAVVMPEGDTEEEFLLFVGRLTPEKGVHVLVDAMEVVARSHPKATLVVAGGFHPNPPSPTPVAERSITEREFDAIRPIYREELERRAAASPADVRLLGDVPHEQLGELYAACDVFVHPSLWSEPFGMSLTEAMLCGCPVVSTRRGGIPEIVVHGETGLLVDEVTPEALAGAITTLLSDPKRRQAMGEAGRRRARECFRWERTATLLLKRLGETG